MEVTLIPTLEHQTWPTTSLSIKRPPPGIAVINRVWRDIHLDRICYLIGDIFEDLAIDYSTIELAIHLKSKSNHVVLNDIRLIKITNKLVEPYACLWQTLHYHTQCFIDIHNTITHLPDIHIMCDRYGLFWDLVKKRPC